jgi:hypothetical protein
VLRKLVLQIVGGEDKDENCTQWDIDLNVSVRSGEQYIRDRNQDGR